MTTTTRTKRPATKSARKPAKKAAPARTATKKPAAQKKPAQKKTAAKKATARKSPAKTSAAKKPANKKAAAKKTASVDPRLKARRVETARVEGRRRLRTLVALIIITVLAIGSLALIDSSAFDVDRVVVNGVVETDPATVVATTEIALGDPLLEVDLNRAARQVETLPWVASAVAERRWNGDIRIEVVEREAVAALEVENTDLFVLIDASGRQLEGVEVRPSHFVPIEGVAASGILAQPAPASARSAVRVVGALPPSLKPQVVSVRVEAANVATPDQPTIEPQILVLTLADGGGQVILGDDSSLAEKMLGLETMLTRVDLRCLDTIDLRVPTAPALTRRSVEGSLLVNDLTTCSSVSPSTEG